MQGLAAGSCQLSLLGCHWLEVHLEDVVLSLRAPARVPPRLAQHSAVSRCDGCRGGCLEGLQPDADLGDWWRPPDDGRHGPRKYILLDIRVGYAEFAAVWLFGRSSSVVLCLACLSHAYRYTLFSFA